MLIITDGALVTRKAYLIFEYDQQITHDLINGMGCKLDKLIYMYIIFMSSFDVIHWLKQ